MSIDLLLFVKGVQEKEKNNFVDFVNRGGAPRFVLVSNEGCVLCQDFKRSPNYERIACNTFEFHLSDLTENCKKDIVQELKTETLPILMELKFGLKQKVAKASKRVVSGELTKLEAFQVAF